VGRRSETERALIRAAKRRLDTLRLYPAPVDVRRVRVLSTPWLFRLPGFRRFHGYEIGPLILVRRPLETVREDLVVHELTHVWQHQHRPIRMWLSYLTQGYRENEHEVEARDAVRSTRQNAQPMPLYDFACDACDERFEALASPGGTAPCPACGTAETRRLFTPIPPPPKLGLRGRAARESDARRADREGRRKQR